MPGFRLFHISAVAIMLLSSWLLQIAAQGTNSTQENCSTSSQPNPVAQQYPQAATGTFNATLAIYTIPLTTARQLILSQYAILEDAYRSLLPDFPADKYPVLLQAGLDHGIRMDLLNYDVPDFQRVGWSFPFVDLLGDGYSSFTWAPAQMITFSNEIAINGSRAYGTEVFPSTFEPGCDAYESLSDGSGIRLVANATDGSGIYATTEFAPLATGTSNPFPVEFYQNITNQPIFVDGASCDNQIRLFNSTLNQGVYTPVPVFGRVSTNLPPMGEQDLTEVYGVLIDTPFVEYNGGVCRTLQGYSGTGPGD